jgi:hypothetical protein
MLDLKWNSDNAKKMQEFFNSLGKDAFYKNHYDFAEITNFSSSQWKEFLTDPQVHDYIRQELALLSQSALQKLTRDVEKNAKSPGTAQTMQAMMKLLDAERGIKEGPVFVYCYIPLNEQEQHADNIRIRKSDPFIRG